MSIEARRRIFFAIFVLFLFISPTVILWSQGYRIDFQKMKIVRVGGFYFKVIPQDSTLILDGKRKIQLKPSILSDGILVGDLIPGIYDVRIQKDEYFPWIKTLEVKPLQVSKNTSIILFKTLPLIEKFGTFETSKFWVDPESSVIYFIDKKGNRLFSVDINRTDPPKELISKDFFSQNPKISIIDVIPSPYNDSFLVKTNAPEFILVSDGGKIKRSISKYFLDSKAVNTIFEKVIWHPELSWKIIFIDAQNRIYEFNLNTLSYKILMKDKDILGFDYKKGFFVDSKGNLYKFSSDEKGAELIDNIVLPPGIKKLNLYVFSKNKYFILDENSNLWKVSKGADPIFVLEGVSKLEANPDATKVAIISKNKILSVYFVKEIFYDILYKENELVKLLLVDEIPSEIFWMKDDWHIILAGPSKVEILEIDKRYPLNRVSYPITSTNFLWQNQQNYLFYSSQNTLWRLKLI